MEACFILSSPCLFPASKAILLWIAREGLRTKDEAPCPRPVLISASRSLWRQSTGYGYGRGLRAVSQRLSCRLSPVTGVAGVSSVSSVCPSGVRRWELSYAPGTSHRKWKRLCEINETTLPHRATFQLSTMAACLSHFGYGYGSSSGSGYGESYSYSYHHQLNFH